MKNELRFIGRLCLCFGLVKGVMLFLKFKLRLVKTIKIPGLEHPVYLRFNTSDILTFDQVILSREQDINFNNPQNIVDAGANIGLFTLKMKNKYPKAKIICVEPDIENFAILRKNVSEYSDIYCENCGIWKRDAKLKVYDKYNLGKWAMVVEEDSKEGNISGLSIPTLLKKYSIKHIDILKLDIETSEKQLFLENFTDWLPAVKTIIIELHDGLEEGCSKTFFEAINKTFSKYKYSIQGEHTIIENKDLN